MAVHPVGSSFLRPDHVATRPAGSSPPSSEDAGFSQFITDFLRETNDHQQQADGALHDLVTGKTENVHDVVLSIAQADLSFRFLLEVRNRLTEAYQEVSRMQL